MRTIIRTITALFVSAAICTTPLFEAAASQIPDRNNRHERPSRQNRHNNQRPQRPGTNGNHNNQRPQRPGANGNHSNQRPQRPGANGNHNNQRPQRPGANGNHSNQRPQRPDGVRPGANVRPDRPSAPNRPHQPARPSAPHHPSQPPRPSNPVRPPHAGLPMRPHMPPVRPFRRPLPPPSWHPVGRYPRLSTILGVTFGTTISLSINALVNSGYNVSGYGNDMVYLTNVPQLNLIWPDATLYYSGGGLAASQFVYATPYSDMGRYNSAYGRLVNLYGAPVEFDNSGGSISASWFGNNGQFVSLTFAPQYTSGGALNYYTTLSFGN